VQPENISNPTPGYSWMCGVLPAGWWVVLQLPFAVSEMVHTLTLSAQHSKPGNDETGAILLSQPLMADTCVWHQI
jgi:hypothetical protein